MERRNLIRDQAGHGSARIKPPAPIAVVTLTGEQIRGKLAAFVASVDAMKPDPSGKATLMALIEVIRAALAEGELSLGLATYVLIRSRTARVEDTALDALLMHPGLARQLEDDVIQQGKAAGR